MTSEVFENLKKWGLQETQIGKFKEAIEGKTKDFLFSPSSVYCQTCGVIFYKGPAFGIMDKSEVIWDFRYLAFRHAWDNPEHQVVVDLPFLKIHTHGLHNGLFDYSVIVNDFKSGLRLKGDFRGWRKCDANWDQLVDRVACSNCKKVFNNIRDACNCCSEAKPFLPHGELDNL